MVDYLVFDTQADADAAELTIRERGFQIAVLQGHTVMDGVLHFAGATGVGTERWDVPQQRVDGKWVVAHPNSYFAAKDPDNGAAWLAIVMAGVGGTVEAHSPTWWPQED